MRVSDDQKQVMISTRERLHFYCPNRKKKVANTYKAKARTNLFL